MNAHSLFMASLMNFHEKMIILLCILINNESLSVAFNKDSQNNATEMLREKIMSCYFLLT